MATRIWQGSTDNWGTAGNWSTATEPISNDTVIIPETSSQGIQTGLDNAAVDLDLLDIGESFTQAIGGSGNPLKLSADKVKFFGGGTFWYEDGDGITDELLIVAATPTVVVNLAGATITAAILNRGTVTCTGTITTMQAGYETNRSTDLNCTITSAAGTLATLHQYGGSIDADNVITAVYKAAGTLVKGGTTAITTLWNYADDCIYDSTGTLVTAHIVGGTLDLTRTAAEKTITDLWLYPDGKVIYDDALTTITTLHVVKSGL